MQANVQTTLRAVDSPATDARPSGARFTAAIDHPSRKVRVGLWTRVTRGLVAGLVLLAAGGFAGSLAVAQTQSANDVVMGAINATLAALREDRDRARNDPDFVVDVLERHILPVIDVQGMGALILGRHWREASREQRERFVASFANTLMRTYGGQLGEHIDADVELISRRSRQDDRQAAVATEVVLPGQNNLVVNYRLRPVGGEWRVFDVEAEGLGFVANFRTSFNEQVARDGLERLIERLEAGDAELVDQVVDDAVESR
ncbi:MAG: phospholipid-binding protein MlaC [Thioalkalivibrionaceae bacterium]